MIRKTVTTKEKKTIKENNQDTKPKNQCKPNQITNLDQTLSCNGNQSISNTNNQHNIVFL